MSMLLPPFTLHEPSTLEEAVATRDAHPESDFLAGGTDLLPNYKWMLNTKPHVISLHRIQELRTISPRRIGALATLTEIANHAELRKSVPVVPATAALIASPLLRNSGTLGGNLLLDNRCFFYNQSHVWRESIGFCLKASGTACHVVPQEDKCYATFSADLPGPLIALGAEFELVGPQGSRRVAARDFYQNDGIDRHHKRPDEILAYVHLPLDAQRLRADYQKLRQRDSWDFPELGIACALRLDEGRLREFHLVANALEMAPVVLDELGQPYVGRAFDDAAIEAIAAKVEERIRPVKNTNLSPSYRKRMSRVFAVRAMRGARDAPGPTL